MSSKGMLKKCGIPFDSEPTMSLPPKLKNIITLPPSVSFNQWI